MDRTLELSTSATPLELHEDDFFYIRWSNTGEWQWFCLDEDDTEQLGKYKYNGWTCKTSGWSIQTLLTETDEKISHPNRRGECLMDYQNEHDIYQEGVMLNMKYGNTRLDPEIGLYKISIININTFINDGSTINTYMSHRKSIANITNIQELKYNRKQSIGTMLYNRNTMAKK